MEFKRKVYDKLLKWKKRSGGRTSVLIEGARRVGKSTVAESFARNEYKSYIIIDFVNASKRILDAFEYLYDIDLFYQNLLINFPVRMYPRKSLIIFDEVQRFPKARESTKYLVKDGRYDIISTGSLISIKENVENIVIPSEEEKIRMYPMDFEEFIWAEGTENLWNHIIDCYQKRTAPDRAVHEMAMRIFREYMLSFICDCHHHVRVVARRRADNNALGVRLKQAFKCIEDRKITFLCEVLRENGVTVVNAYDLTEFFCGFGIFFCVYMPHAGYCYFHQSKYTGFPVLDEV